jgi:hypothetical protein
MRLLTLHELLYLSRAELFALHADIVRKFEEMTEDSVDRQIALANLRLISRVLSRYEFVFARGPSR